MSSIVNNNSKNFLSGKSYLLWLVLAIPSIGEFSARLLVIALLISPLRTVFSQLNFLQTLMKHRRKFGLMAFYYVVIHLAAYLLYKNFDAVISDLSQVTYVAGWIALIIFVPLALTSTNTMVRKLRGKKWKNLHRLVYLAAIVTALHWLLKNGDEDHSPWPPVLVDFGPLLILETNRYLNYHKTLTSSKI